MRGEGGSRLAWADLPGGLRRAVGDLLGAPVVAATSQVGGFSPGSADRVVTGGGHRAFVKAGELVDDGGLGALHRREACVLAQLPPGLPVPGLRGTVEVDGWFALVVEDVEGRTPALPWRPVDVAAALAAFERLAAEPVTSGLAAVLPTAHERMAVPCAGFERLAADPDPHLDPWAAARLDALAALARRGVEALDGSQLVHDDVRADNLLVRHDGRVVVVDWPHAFRGAAWSDLVGLLLNVRVSGSPDVDADAVLAGHAPDDDATAFLAGMTAYFLDAARQPPPPGLPRLRAFQAVQGRVALAWLRERV